MSARDRRRRRAATCSTRRPSTRRQLVMRAADPAQRRAREAAPGRRTTSSAPRTLDTTLAGRATAPRGLAAGARARSAPRPPRRVADGVEHPDPLRPRRRPRPRADPVAAGRRRRAPPPRARGHAPAGRPRRRVGRAARGPPLRAADRLRRRGVNPYLALESLRELRADGAAAGGVTPTRPQRYVIKAHRQGPAEDDLEDGHLDRPVLPRRADLRGGRARAAASIDRYFTGTASRIGGIGCACSRSEALRPPRARLPRHGPRPSRAAGRRPLPAGAAAASTTCGTRTRSRAAARGARTTARETLRGVRRRWSTRTRPRRDAARAAEASGERRRRSRSRRSSRRKEIVKRFATGAMSLGLDLARGARDARDRDEPARRPLEHRRGRRGPAPLRPTPTATCAARRSSRWPRAASA